MDAINLAKRINNQLTNKARDARTNSHNGHSTNGNEMEPKILSNCQTKKNKGKYGLSPKITLQTHRTPKKKCGNNMKHTALQSISVRWLARERTLTSMDGLI